MNFKQLSRFMGPLVPIERKYHVFNLYKYIRHFAEIVEDRDELYRLYTLDESGRAVYIHRLISIGYPITLEEFLSFTRSIRLALESE